MSARPLVFPSMPSACSLPQRSEGHQKLLRPTEPLTLKAVFLLRMYLSPSCVLYTYRSYSPGYGTALPRRQYCDSPVSGLALHGLTY